MGESTAIDEHGTFELVESVGIADVSFFVFDTDTYVPEVVDCWREAGGSEPVVISNAHEFSTRVSESLGVVAVMAHGDAANRMFTNLAGEFVAYGDMPEMRCETLYSFVCGQTRADSPWRGKSYDALVCSRDAFNVDIKKLMAAMGAAIDVRDVHAVLATAAVPTYWEVSPALEKPPFQVAPTIE